MVHNNSSEIVHISKINKKLIVEDYKNEIFLKLYPEKQLEKISFNQLITSMLKRAFGNHEYYIKIGALQENS